MEMYIKDIWWKLRTWVSREQSFLIMLYLAFAVYLEQTETERGREETELRTDPGSRLVTRSRSGWRETEDLKGLRRLRNIFEEISEYELERTADELEESITWKELAGEKKCAALVRDLNRELKKFIQSREDLEKVITILEELPPELDGLQLTPKSVNRLMAVLPVNPGTSSMAALYAGLGGTGLTVFDRRSGAGGIMRMVCEEQRKLYCDLTRIRMFCHGIPQPKVLQRDILEPEAGDSQGGFDLVLADLPKGKNESMLAGKQGSLTGRREKLYAEWVSIQRILERVNDRGKAMIVVTKGALVRQREQELRAILTRRDWLEAVITLPANLYASIHTGFELLVLNKQKPAGYQGRVFMAELKEKKQKGGGLHEISEEMISRLQKAYENLEEHAGFSVVVSLEEIAEKEFSWNPFLYLRWKTAGYKSRRTVALGTVATIIRGAQITKKEEEMYSRQATHYWLNIRDLEDGRISFPEHSRLRAKASDWEEKFGIQEGDIIMTSKGSVLKICMVEPGMPKAFLSGNLTRIRVNPEKYSSCVLYEFLTSQEGREALDSIQSGTTIKIYNKTNLSRLQIPYYENARELQEQFRQVYEEYRTSMQEIRQKFISDRERLLKKLQ